MCPLFLCIRIAKKATKSKDGDEEVKGKTIFQLTYMTRIVYSVSRVDLLTLDAYIHKRLTRAPFTTFFCSFLLLWQQLEALGVAKSG